MFNIKPKKEEIKPNIHFNLENLEDSTYHEFNGTVNLLEELYEAREEMFDKGLSDGLKSFQKIEKIKEGILK